MATTYTSGLRLTNQEEGANPNTWGIIADNNFEFIDDAITDETSVNITGAASYTLTTNNGADDEARKYGIYVYGIPSSANSIIIPASKKPYQIRTAHTSITGGITIRTATGTGVSFLTGQLQDVYCDGLSVYTKGIVSALDPSDNLSDLPNVSAARVNLGFGSLAAVSALGSGFSVSAGKLEFSIAAAYPVGSIYLNASDNTNPATLLGFGTWTAFGASRMLLGAGTGSGLTARTAGDTGGAETVVLTQGNLPNISLSFNTQTNTASNGGTVVYKANGPVDGTQTVSLGGSDTPVSIMNPFIVVYMWRRTA